jgi:hypothetical protein
MHRSKRAGVQASISGGGDATRTTTFPEALREFAEDWESYERYEYASHQTMPVPVQPHDPFTATITLAAGDGAARRALTFFYREGALERVRAAPVLVESGTL